MSQLWCRDHPEFLGSPADRAKVQLSAAMLVYCLTSTRTGEVHEHTARRRLAQDSNENPEDRELETRVMVACYKLSFRIPKPIIWTLDSAVKHMHMQALKVPEGFEGQDQKNFGKRVFVTLPAFHAAGLATILLITVPVNATAIIYVYCCWSANCCQSCGCEKRDPAALLVELGEKTLNVNDRAAMIDQPWPSIEQANAAAPAHARISKSHILFASSKKPSCRASKGTVQRAQTGGLEDATKVAAYINASILAIAIWSKLSDTDNWFNLGLHSLQPITATRVFKHGPDIPSLAPNTIYLNPTVLGLTRALQSLHQHIEASKENEKNMQMQERELLLQELIGQIDHTTQTPKLLEQSPVAQSVVLTGSTGQLGAYLLDCLLKNHVVEHVYCLNRDGSNRDRSQQRERGAAFKRAAADASRPKRFGAKRMPDNNVLDTKATAQASEKLQEIDAVVPEWIQKWVREWSAN
ncbi:acetyl-CoA synthetase-like protein [Penicillium tannophilum]|nr:acetyl-CoA synthetase-like protein [Penicillium tannophilum]